MKSFITAFILSVLTECSIGFAQGGIWFGDDTQIYSPGEWEIRYADWRSPPFIRDTIQSSVPNVSGRYGKYSPPGHYTTAPGINDTITIGVRLDNRTKKDYDLSGKNPEQWFAPQLYDATADIYKAMPYLDSTQINYRFWRMGGPGAEKKAILAATRPTVALQYDVWDIPEGKWQLALMPTANFPKDIHPCGGGGPIVVFKAATLRDSIAAYEGLYWRMITSGDTVSARKFVDTIFVHNENSFVGWGLRLELAYIKLDKAAILAACEKALGILEGGKDPTVPHLKDLDPNLPDEINYRWYEHFDYGITKFRDDWSQ